MKGCGLRSEGALSCISSFSTIPSPDLSSCLRCGLRFPSSDNIDWFRTLDSQWRIVLLCYDCLDAVRSAKVCSYCFVGIPELEKGILSCIACSCRVHHTCIPLHHRNLRPSLLDTDKFICVDCCPVYRFRGEDLTKSGSRTGFSFLLENLGREAKSNSVKEVTTDGNASNNTVNRAMVARSSTEVTKNALAGVHLVREPTYINTVPDEVLALRLHRSINGSPRISRTFCPKGKTRLNFVRKVQESNCSDDRVVGSNSCGHHVNIEDSSENKSFLDGKNEVCFENKFLEDRETSQSIMTSKLLETTNEDLLKPVKGYNAECLEGVSLKEKDIVYMSPDSNSDCSNVGSASFSMNSLLDNTMPLTMFRFGVGEGSSQLRRKMIDASGSDMCSKKYFRRQLGSRRFLAGS